MDERLNNLDQTSFKEIEMNDKGGHHSIVKGTRQRYKNISMENCLKFVYHKDPYINKK